MALPYREFGTSVLSDLAIRETENDRITFRGNHVSAQHPFPARLQGETDKEFAARLAKFRTTLPRHSDFSERLALAVKAFMLAGEKSFAAADLVREILRKAPAEMKDQYEKRGIGHAFRPIDAPIGTTRRNRRTKRKKRGISREERQAESIRAQASRFVHDHKNFEDLLQTRLGSFRYQCCRDADWFASVEPSYIARVEAFEQRREPFDWYTAMPVAVAARFYHEQRKFPQALLYYRKAMDAARRAVMHEDLRAFVLRWLELEVNRCELSEEMIPMPPYRGPWLPVEKAPVSAG
jgi:hypothetical protein